MHTLRNPFWGSGQDSNTERQYRTKIRAPNERNTQRYPNCSVCTGLLEDKNEKTRTKRERKRKKKKKEKENEKESENERNERKEPSRVRR